MNREIGGILLVTGTTIGAGMLALPVETGFAGFLPSAALFVFYWIFMTYTALLFLEVNLWMENGTNMVTMVQKTLGKGGAFISWIAYLYLLYALTTAYLAGSAPTIQLLLHHIGFDIPQWLASLPLIALFMLFLALGTQTVDRFNRLLMIGLTVAYGALLILLTPHVEPLQLTRQEWPLLWGALSVAATSFGFHIIIPSLTTYLHRDPVRLKRVIMIGSTIPLVVYLLWNLIALGILPIPLLEKGYAQGINGAALLADYLSSPLLQGMAQSFSFFAIVTSFLGVSLSLMDFLADGLKIPKQGGNMAILLSLTFFPPLGLALTNPRAFLSALEYAGAYGVVFLLGLIPVLMVAFGRYRHYHRSTFKAPGGKIALFLAGIVSVLIIAVEGLRG